MKFFNLVALIDRIRELKKIKSKGNYLAIDKQKGTSCKSYNATSDSSDFKGHTGVSECSSLRSEHSFVIVEWPESSDELEESERSLENVSNTKVAVKAQIWNKFRRLWRREDYACDAAEENPTLDLLSDNQSISSGVSKNIIYESDFVEYGLQIDQFGGVTGLFSCADPSRCAEQTLLEAHLLPDQAFHCSPFKKNNAQMQSCHW